uniref:C-type lectin domain-containing protein n=1 Tax=Xiphophorus couchianus TaxID=32473 RepID=A0A3B5KR43_9TELE
MSLHGNDFFWKGKDRKYFRIFWGEGQPDNVNGSEDCAQILEVNKTWNDNKCDGSFPWICEKAPV